MKYKKGDVVELINSKGWTTVQLTLQQGEGMRFTAPETDEEYKFPELPKSNEIEELIRRAIFNYDKTTMECIDYISKVNEVANKAISKIKELEKKIKRLESK